MRTAERTQAGAVVRIPAGDGVLIEGSLERPAAERGLVHGVVLFAHGSGSSRFSPRNNFVAAELRRAGMATLLLDLLTPAEDQDLRARFDISLLTERLGHAARWLKDSPAVRSRSRGVCGGSTGAAAALQLAASIRRIPGAVDVHIAQVRKKLRDSCTITTVRGVGYRLESAPPAHPG